MRRNTLRIIKYVIAVGILYTCVSLLYQAFKDGGAPYGNDKHGKQKGNAFLPNDYDSNVNNPGPVKHMEESDGAKHNGHARSEQILRNRQELKESEMKKIDWHNYSQIAAEKLRVGPGEQGAAIILSAEDEKLKEPLYRANGFNAFVSDKIAMDRALNDIRHPECKNQKYWNKLPNVSVIVPFHNEHWSTLIRLVTSINNRTPPGLIHEIILADDHSMHIPNKDFLGKQLEDYVAKHWNNVKIIRAKKREGLIRARIFGAEAATGDVLLFLDSHCEVGINWLPPLLDPIQDDYRTVVCPFIDVVDYENFAYRAQDEGRRGAFDWELFYKRLAVTDEDEKNMPKPFKSPVMAGGLFAISRKWFWELGGYDPELQIWGGEQYELSFKLWQCGGEMFDVPCSRIGHVYRGKYSPFPNPGLGDFVGRNFRRVAEVWMDEYKEHIYKRRPHYKKIDMGDISDQLAIRKKLNCKSFKWFMETVAFDLTKSYPPVEPEPFAQGEFKNEGAGMCLDTRFRNRLERFGIEPCISEGGGGGEQDLMLSWRRDLRPKKRGTADAICFDASASNPKSPVVLYECHGQKGNQFWKYNVDTRQLFHPISRQCLEADKYSKEVFMNPCDDSSKSQKWHIAKVSPTIKKLWDEKLDEKM